MGSRLPALMLAPALAWTAPPAAAQEAPASATPLRIVELAGHPFQEGGLTVTVTHLNGYRLIAPERRHAGRGRVRLSIHNPGATFRTFSPQGLALVGKSGLQVFPLYELNLADDTVPTALRLAPGARFEVEYVLTGRLTFPAKLYLGDQLVAEVTE